MPRISVKKSYYELKRSEKKEYFEEFNDLPYIKKIKNSKDLSFYLFFIFLIMSVVSLYVDFEVLVPYINCYVKLVTLSVFIYYLGLEVYYRISFMRWLKIKYKVEY